MITAAIQAFKQMFTPAFRAVLLKCLGFTVALFLLLIVGVEWVFSYFVAWPDWIEKTIQWLGGFVLVAAAIFLNPTVTSLMAGL
jgi:CysZ protein